MHDLIDANSILVTERGSVTYGTAISPEEAEAHGIAPSDVDYMRVYVAPLEQLLSLRDLPEALSRTNPDEEVHELRHFIRLCSKGNPNLLECLFVLDEHVLSITGEGRFLRENAFLFLAKRTVGASYRGYIQHQIQRYVLRDPNGHWPQGRKALWQRFGYDTKAAGHIARLLIQGAHALRTGRLHVRLDPQESEMVKHIRLGQISKPNFLGLVDALMDDFRKAEAESVLPDEPDLDAIDDLYRQLLERFHSSRGHQLKVRAR